MDKEMVFVIYLFKDLTSRYRDIGTLNFIWEGADTFYVIRYDEHGSEISRYNDLMKQQRRSSILVTVGNDLDYEHMLYGPDWEKLKRCFDFTNGKRVVLTNMLRNDLRVLVVGDDGYEINHENIPRIKGHFVVHEDEEAVFYETLCRHVKNESSLAIPSDIVSANDLFIFEHAKILYGKKSYRLELHQEFYNDDPSCVNEIEWYDLVDSERFLINGYDAMLEDLGIKDGSILFSRFRIPRKSMDEGLLPLMSNKDMLSLLQYVPIYKEIEVYVEKNMMEVVLGTCKGVVIEEVVGDDEDPYHGEDEDEENVELFDEQDHLLEHVPFLKETVIIVDGDSLLLAVDALVVPPVIDLEEQLERPNKRRKLNPA
nr:hypothetical protein [Tanacetum cinerariifolium]